jgi:hypothetical protein
MLETREEYLTSENELDLANKYIESNQTDKLYE